MRRAILTGFQPFGSYEFNPVQDTTEFYDKKTIGDIEVRGLVLPCAYYGAFEVLSEEIDRFSPEIILGTGLASSVPRIRLESIGRNIMDGKYPDADGKDPKRDPIIEGGLPFYRVNSESINLARILQESGIPSEVSVDAEGFICNSQFYLTARRIAIEGLPINFAFFHTPWTNDYTGKIELAPEKVMITKGDLGRTIETLIENM